MTLMRKGLTIGDFSQVTHLSVKTLRRYHESGLLNPAQVDADTGYRYYSTAQIPTAQVIRRFRDLVGGSQGGLQPLTGYNEGDLYIGAGADLGRGTLVVVFQGVRQYDGVRSERSTPNSPSSASRARRGGWPASSPTSATRASRRGRIARACPTIASPTARATALSPPASSRTALV